jgi:Lipopolysaccharide-assembly
VHRLFHLSLLVCGLALTGCAGYRLGPTNGETARAHSVQINPFVNKTLEPRLSEYVASTLRKNLQQDGTYRINTHNEGDIILSGVIISYIRSELSFQSSDVITVQDYEIRMTAQITARERSTGKTIFDQRVIGRTTLRVGNDLTSAERQAIPLLADDLAKKTTALLVDGTW